MSEDSTKKALLERIQFARDCIKMARTADISAWARGIVLDHADTELLMVGLQIEKSE